jgi:hypothetical protein
MAVRILSNMNLEVPKTYDIFEIAPKAPYLALLGDTGNVALHKDDCLAFLTRQLINQFQAVLFVPGNHEAYHSSSPERLDILRTYEQDVHKNPLLGDFVLLDRAAFLPESNIAILGCSLFSFIHGKVTWRLVSGSTTFSKLMTRMLMRTTWHMSKILLGLTRRSYILNNLKSKSRFFFLHWSPSQDTHTIDSRHTGSSIMSVFSTDLSGEACFTSEEGVMDC